MLIYWYFNLFDVQDFNIFQKILYEFHNVLMVGDIN